MPKKLNQLIACLLVAALVFQTAEPGNRRTGERVKGLFSDAPVLRCSGSYSLFEEQALAARAVPFYQNLCRRISSYVCRMEGNQSGIYHVSPCSEESFWEIFLCSLNPFGISPPRIQSAIDVETLQPLVDRLNDQIRRPGEGPSFHPYFSFLTYLVVELENLLRLIPTMGPFHITGIKIDATKDHVSVYTDSGYSSQEVMEARLLRSLNGQTLPMFNRLLFKDGPAVVPFVGDIHKPNGEPVTEQELADAGWAWVKDPNGDFATLPVFREAGVPNRIMTLSVPQKTRIRIEKEGGRWRLLTTLQETEAFVRERYGEPAVEECRRLADSALATSKQIHENPRDMEDGDARDIYYFAELTKFLKSHGHTKVLPVAAIHFKGGGGDYRFHFPRDAGSPAEQPLSGKDPADAEEFNLPPRVVDPRYAGKQGIFLSPYQPNSWVAINGAGPEERDATERDNELLDHGALLSTINLNWITLADHERLRLWGVDSELAPLIMSQRIVLDDTRSLGNLLEPAIYEDYIRTEYQKDDFAAGRDQHLQELTETLAANIAACLHCRLTIPANDISANPRIGFVRNISPRGWLRDTGDLRPIGIPYEALPLIKSMIDGLRFTAKTGGMDAARYYQSDLFDHLIETFLQRLGGDEILLAETLRRIKPSVDLLRSAADDRERTVRLLRIVHILFEHWMAASGQGNAAETVGDYVKKEVECDGLEEFIKPWCQVYLLALNASKSCAKLLDALMIENKPPTDPSLVELCRAVVRDLEEAIDQAEIADGPDHFAPLRSALEPMRQPDIATGGVWLFPCLIELSKHVNNLLFLPYANTIVGLVVDENKISFMKGAALAAASIVSAGRFVTMAALPDIGLDYFSTSAGVIILDYGRFPGIAAPGMMGWNIIRRWFVHRQLINELSARIVEQAFAGSDRPGGLELAGSPLAIEADQETVETDYYSLQAIVALNLYGFIYTESHEHATQDLRHLVRGVRLRDDDRILASASEFVIRELGKALGISAPNSGFQVDQAVSVSEVIQQKPVSDIRRAAAAVMKVNLTLPVGLTDSPPFDDNGELNVYSDLARALTRLYEAAEELPAPAAGVSADEAPGNGESRHPRANLFPGWKYTIHFETALSTVLLLAPTIGGAFLAVHFGSGNLWVYLLSLIGLTAGFYFSATVWVLLHIVTPARYRWKEAVALMPDLFRILRPVFYWVLIVPGVIHHFYPSQTLDILIGNIVVASLWGSLFSFRRHWNSEVAGHESHSTSPQMDRLYNVSLAMSDAARAFSLAVGGEEALGPKEVIELADQFIRNGKLESIPAGKVTEIAGAISQRRRYRFQISVVPQLPEWLEKSPAPGYQIVSAVDFADQMERQLAARLISCKGTRAYFSMKSGGIIQVRLFDPVVPMEIDFSSPNRLREEGKDISGKAFRAPIERAPPEILRDLATGSPEETLQALDELIEGMRFLNAHHFKDARTCPETALALPLIKAILRKAWLPGDNDHRLVIKAQRFMTHAVQFGPLADRIQMLDLIPDILANRDREDADLHTEAGHTLAMMAGMYAFDNDLQANGLDPKGLKYSTAHLTAVLSTRPLLKDSPDEMSAGPFFRGWFNEAAFVLEMWYMNTNAGERNAVLNELRTGKYGDIGLRLRIALRLDPNPVGWEIADLLASEPSEDPFDSGTAAVGDSEPPASPGMTVFWELPFMVWIPEPVRVVLAGFFEPIWYRVVLPVVLLASHPRELFRWGAINDKFVDDHGGTDRQTDEQREIRADLAYIEGAFWLVGLTLSAIFGALAVYQHQPLDLSLAAWVFGRALAAPIIPHLSWNLYQLFKWFIARLKGDASFSPVYGMARTGRPPAWTSDKVVQFLRNIPAETVYKYPGYLKSIPGIMAVGTTGLAWAMKLAGMMLIGAEVGHAAQMGGADPAMGARSLIAGATLFILPWLLKTSDSSEIDGPSYRAQAEMMRDQISTGATRLLLGLSDKKNNPYRETIERLCTQIEEGTLRLGDIDSPEQLATPAGQELARLRDHLESLRPDLTVGKFVKALIQARLKRKRPRSGSKPSVSATPVAEETPASPISQVVAPAEESIAPPAVSPAKPDVPAKTGTRRGLQAKPVDEALVEIRTRQFILAQCDVPVMARMLGMDQNFVRLKLIKLGISNSQAVMQKHTRREWLIRDFVEAGGDVNRTFIRRRQYGNASTKEDLERELRDLWVLDAQGEIIDPNVAFLVDDQKRASDAAGISPEFNNIETRAIILAGAILRNWNWRPRYFVEEMNRRWNTGVEPTTIEEWYRDGRTVEAIDRLARELGLIFPTRPSRYGSLPGILLAMASSLSLGWILKFFAAHVPVLGSGLLMNADLAGIDFSSLMGNLLHHSETFAAGLVGAALLAVGAFFITSPASVTESQRLQVDARDGLLSNRGPGKDLAGLVCNEFVSDRVLAWVAAELYKKPSDEDPSGQLLLLEKILYSPRAGEFAASVAILALGKLAEASFSLALKVADILETVPDGHLPAKELSRNALASLATNQSWRTPSVTQVAIIYDTADREDIDIEIERLRTAVNEWNAGPNTPIRWSRNIYWKDVYFFPPASMESRSWHIILAGGKLAYCIWEYLKDLLSDLAALQDDSLSLTVTLPIPAILAFCYCYREREIWKTRLGSALALLSSEGRLRGVPIPSEKEKEEFIPSDIPLPGSIEVKIVVDGFMRRVLNAGAPKKLVLNVLTTSEAMSRWMDTAFTRMPTQVPPTATPVRIRVCSPANGMAAAA
jgi:hypothetical protein